MSQTRPQPILPESLPYDINTREGLARVIDDGLTVQRNGYTRTKQDFLREFWWEFARVETMTQAVQLLDHFVMVDTGKIFSALSRSSVTGIHHVLDFKLEQVVKNIRCGDAVATQTLSQRFNDLSPLFLKETTETACLIAEDLIAGHTPAVIRACAKNFLDVLAPRWKDTHISFTPS